MNEEKQTSTTKTHKNGQQSRQTKQKDINPDVWQVLSRKTIDGVTFITEVMNLSHALSKKAIQRDTVIKNGSVAVTTSLIDGLSVEHYKDPETEKTVLGYKGGNIGHHNRLK